jgi:hypothetical protein
MERNNLRAPLNQVSEEDEELLIDQDDEENEELLINQVDDEKLSFNLNDRMFALSEDDEPKLAKAQSTHEYLKYEIKDDINYNVSRISSKSFNYRVVMNKLAVTSGDDVRESIIQKKDDILDGVRRFYHYSGEPSHQDPSSRLVRDSLEVPDLEVNK